MNKINSFTRGSSLLKTNLKYGLIGILVGLAIVAIKIVFGGGISMKSALFNVLFSLFITLSITNIVVVVLNYTTPSKAGFWKYVLIYYVCNIIGMVLGIELTNLIIDLIYNIPIEFIFNHLDDYRSSSIIVLIVGTVLLLYHLQNVNSDAMLAAKDKDLALLSQLKTQAELQALQSKINPHFLYNALNSIVSLIHEDAAKAEDMTLKLAKLFRYSLNSMHENFSTVKEEVEILNTYLEIERVRFGDRIRFKIEVDPALESRSMPRFLLQPLVENALKHGLKDVADGGELKVVITAIEQQLVLQVYDNGVDFPEGLISGYGLQSTYDKLQLLYNEAYEMQMINNPDKHIRISIPLT